LKGFKLTPQQQAIVDLPLTGRISLHGEAGSGKTSAAVQRMLSLINRGVPADSILVLVPQRSLAEPFNEVLYDPAFPGGGQPAILTIGGLAQRMLSLFWPLISQKAGFANPHKPPAFLTLETAQYHLAGLIEPLLQKGYFESVVIDPNRLYSQILDNLNKSAVVGFHPADIASRLTNAWAGKPAQTIIYQQAQECALLFREFCLKENLLDFSLQLSIFTDLLFQEDVCKDFLKTTYRYLIYDNAEEDYPVAHDLVRKCLTDFESALIVSDEEGGMRTFMGADPISAEKLRRECEQEYIFQGSLVKTKELKLLEDALRTSLCHLRYTQNLDAEIQKSFSIRPFRFYPQGMDWIVEQVSQLIKEHKTAPEEIAILTPFLSDSLRFALDSRFQEAGIRVSTFRPSRGLRDEPAVKALFTLVKLAFPGLQMKPSRDEIRNAMLLVLEDCDYIRADLISQILFSVSSGTLRSFDPVKKEMQQRLTYLLGERFERLRSWLEDYSKAETFELDLFIGRLFGEVLSQPGYRFHVNFDAAAAINRLVESARKFRQVMQPDTSLSLEELNKDYIHLVESGILSAQYMGDWSARSRQGSVLISPAFSFLMSNHPVRFQFWLDIGSQGWWTRLDQPLTHPFVLNRNWLQQAVWMDANETNAGQQALLRITSGLIRRCHEHVFMCTLGVNEQGSEERGELMMAVQSILRILSAASRGSNV